MTIDDPGVQSAVAEAKKTEAAERRQHRWHIAYKASCVIGSVALVLAVLVGAQGKQTADAAKALGSCTNEQLRQRADASDLQLSALVGYSEDLTAALGHLSEATTQAAARQAFVEVVASQKTFKDAITEVKKQRAAHPLGTC